MIHGMGAFRRSILHGDLNLSPQKISWEKLKSHLGPFFLHHKWAILIGTLCMILTLGLGKAPPLLLRFLVDYVVLPIHQTGWTRDSYLHSLWLGAIVIIGMVGISLVNFLLTSLRVRTIRRAGATIVRDLRQYVYTHLQKLSLRFYDNSQTGELISRTTGDVETIERFFTELTDRLIINVLNLLVTMCIIFYLNWKLAWIALIPIPILLFLMTSFSQKIRPVFRQIRDRLGQVYAKLQDNISGIRVIRTFNKEHHESQLFAEKNNAFYQSQLEEIHLTSKFFPLLHFVEGTGMILITAVGIWLLIQPQPSLSLGDLFAFHAFVLQLYQPIGMLFHGYSLILQTGASAERIIEVLEEEPDVLESPDAIELPKVKGEICFKDVSFSYHSSSKVLEGINLYVSPGEIVALVGRSGAGKSTLINLIPRFYDPTQGDIFIDGYNIRKVTLSSLRSQISIVLQDTFLFNGTVRDNIAYSRPNASQEEIESAARAAFAEEFIQQLPHGYHTEIGERGVKLSGGQKQRIAIARAILANRPILILDEATSMLDTYAERQIQQALLHLMKGRTTFVIAHRLSTIQHAHQILVIEEGKIVEQGTHQELIRNQGIYREMCQQQFGHSYTLSAY